PTRDNRAFWRLAGFQAVTPVHEPLRRRAAVGGGRHTRLGRSGVYGGRGVAGRSDRCLSSAGGGTAKYIADAGRRRRSNGCREWGRKCSGRLRQSGVAGRGKTGGVARLVAGGPSTGPSRHGTGDGRVDGQWGS